MALAWLFLFAGAFIGSYAAWHPKDTVLWAWAWRITPFGFETTARFWTGVGTVLVVMAIGQIPLTMRFYASKPIQYLGSISFSFYLVHFWLVQGFGTLILFDTWSITGNNNVILASIGFLLGYSVLLGLTIWVADMFMRCVDERLVVASAKVQKTLFQAG